MDDKRNTEMRREFHRILEHPIRHHLRWRYGRDGWLVPGNRVNGPAVVEAKDTTYVIPADKSYYISEYSHGVLEEV